VLSDIERAKKQKAERKQKEQTEDIELQNQYTRMLEE
jgi:hypothetical protein